MTIRSCLLTIVFAKKTEALAGFCANLRDDIEYHANRDDHRANKRKQFAQREYGHDVFDENDTGSGYGCWNFNGCGLSAAIASERELCDRGADCRRDRIRNF